MTREDAFKAVYGVETPKEVLGLFIEDLKQIKRKSKSKAKHLHELSLLMARYGYAVYYHYETVSIRNNRSKYRREAINILGEEVAAEYFSLMPIVGEQKASKPVEPKKVVEGECVARSEINRLKAELDNKTYKLTIGQKEIDQEIFIKVVLVALSIGAKYRDIMEALEISERKGTVHFLIDEVEKAKGVILELDAKTVKGYLKDIRNHYKERIAENIDISSGIRKAIRRLDIAGCRSIGNLNKLYRDCLTSSEQ